MSDKCETEASKIRNGKWGQNRLDSRPVWERSALWAVSVALGQNESTAQWMGLHHCSLDRPQSRQCHSIAG